VNWSREQLTALQRLLRLKQVLRRGWTRHPIPADQVESVADHSYGLALLCLLLCPADLNRERVLELALIHDLAEVETGDVIPADGVLPDLKRQQEKKALEELLREVPGSEYHLETLREYQQAATPEARWVKDVDKLEMYLQSLNYEADFSVDLQEFRDSSQRALVSLFSREKNDRA